jgi:hypothetical protein
MPGESGSHLDMQYCADVHRGALALASIAASLKVIVDHLEAQTKGEADAAHRKTE